MGNASGNTVSINFSIFTICIDLLFSKLIRSNVFKFATGAQYVHWFWVDWVLESCAILMSTVLYISAGSFYIGVCAYINAMVTDMKERLKSSAFGSNYEGN